MSQRGVAGRSVSIGALMGVFWVLTCSMVHFIHCSRALRKKPGEVIGPGHQGLHMPC